MGLFYNLRESCILLRTESSWRLVLGWRRDTILLGAHHGGVGAKSCAGRKEKRFERVDAHPQQPDLQMCSRAAAARAAACTKCRSRSTCALMVGGANPSHSETFMQLGSVRPSSLNLMPEKSVFRRSLPGELVAFSSGEGRQRFAEAMADGTMEPYFPLVEQFVTQNEPTFCGLGTLTMVMNALRIDPRRRWRDETGPGWRWWSDEMFPTSCTGSLEYFRVNGSTMEEFRLLAIANGAEVSMHRPTDLGESLDSFRSAMVEAGSTASSSFTVTSFNRGSLGQTGTHAHARASTHSKIPSVPFAHLGTALSSPSATPTLTTPPPLLPLLRTQAAATSLPSAVTTPSRIAP